ncbi:hypothetical protein FSP39_022758 [Pinctada imbricata]|uniref:Uncharacterized protein n=1 Tax=Pinctada imbricata TaxID=66713 RepID=A0AA88YT35_PINIB|nr:hypothetical protein FSP39_022758 [Pinctada imbricata]
MIACDGCGLVFTNIHNLQKHVKYWCYENSKRKREDTGEEDDIKSNVPLIKKRLISSGDPYDSEEDLLSRKNEEEQSVYDNIMDQTKDMNADEWNELYDKYIAEGMQRWEANKRADLEMKTKDMYVFLKKYESFITSMLKLENGSIHKKIMQDAESFMENGCSKQKSINLALHKNEYFFREMFDIDESDYTEPDDEEED